MNLEYFKCKICDELEDAKEYATSALEIRAMKPEWQNHLLNMSSNELDHAARLYSMFQEYYSKITASYSEIPKCMEETASCIHKCYSTLVTEVRWLHEQAKK